MSSLIMPIVEDQYRFITEPGTVHPGVMCGGYDVSSKLGAPLKIFAPTSSRFCRNGSSAMGNRQFREKLNSPEGLQPLISPQQQQQPKLPTTRYKTELCRTFEETGGCKYGDKCQFAHGVAEIRQMPRHPKYKTEMCRTYHSTGICPYGPRCHFVHERDGLVVSTTPSPQQQPGLMESRRSGSVASCQSGSPPPSSGSESPLQSFSPRENHFDDDNIFTHHSTGGHFQFQSAYQQQHAYMPNGEMFHSRMCSPPVSPPLNDLSGEDFVPPSPVDLMMSQFDWLSRTTGVSGGKQHRLPVFTRLSSSS